VLRLLDEAGWYEVAQRGSHRQLKHPSKPGRVTVHGKPSDDIAPGTLNQEVREPMRYAVVIEKAQQNYSAYVPDLPGCVATGNSVAETQQAIREAIELHLSGMREDGVPFPPPSSQVDYIDVAA